MRNVFVIVRHAGDEGRNPQDGNMSLQRHVAACCSAAPSGGVVEYGF